MIGSAKWRNTARIAEICKFPITSLCGFTFPSDNKFINPHASFSVSHASVFNRYSCLHDKSNCTLWRQGPVCQTKIYISCKSRPARMTRPSVRDRFDNRSAGRALRSPEAAPRGGKRLHNVHRRKALENLFVEYIKFISTNKLYIS